MFSNFKKRPEYLVGRRSEELVCRFLIERGWFVIPAFDYSGPPTKEHAPVMHGLRESVVVPDIDAAKGGTRCWLEVKYKARAAPSRQQQADVHGIEKASWDHYLNAQRQTGQPVFIAVHEGSTGDVLCRSMDHLIDFYYGKMVVGRHKKKGEADSQRSPMVYLRRELFHVLFNVDDPAVDGSVPVFSKPGPGSRSAATLTPSSPYAEAPVQGMMDFGRLTWDG